MSYSFYRISKEEQIAWVYLNRPEKKNAMGPDAWRELPLVAAELDQDRSLGVVEPATCELHLTQVVWAASIDSLTFRHAPEPTVSSVKFTPR